MSTGPDYTGVDNLEMMEVAQKYLAHLRGRVTYTLDAPGTQRVLDFGAGSGTMARALRDEGYRVSCLEPDPLLLGMLTDSGFECGDDLATLRGADGFDAAYSMNVLEHIDDDVAALRGIFDALKPGGRLTIYVPAFPILFTAMDEKVGHVRRYKKPGLTAAVSAAGFTVDSCQYVDSLGFLAALVYKAIGNRDGDLDERALSLYDSYAFPVSLAIDHVTKSLAGKNLLVYARRP
ncbi:MAG: class I SAM-dependent methyltransferase [Acidimicrobiia bacterium]